MGRKKITNLKQKIISIPIIIVTLIGFIVPNYAHAGILDDIGEDIGTGLIQLTMIIPDAIITVLQRKMLGWPDDEPVIREVDESSIAKLSEFVGNFPIVGKWAEKGIDVAHFVGNGVIASLLGEKNIFSPVGAIENVFDGIRDFLGFETGSYVISTIMYTPKMIFAGEVPLLKINFFSTADSSKSIAFKLKEIIATWYYALRNIALVAMLIMLVYTGIKIMLSSAAGDKAKYKEMLMNWLIGICLILFIHYFMVFMIKLNNSIVDMITQSGGADDVINIARMKVSDESTQSDEYISLTDRFGYGLIYFVLVIYTLIFTWQYLKRVVKLAFLILFAPIIAAIYPIDKMADGQAQGFNAWIKDFIFTLLIQPLHLILYTILIGSVSDLVNSNMIYALVALGSLIPLEAMLRNYLGFGRARDGIKPPNPAGLLAASSLLGGLGKKLLPSNVSGGSGNGPGGNDSGKSGNSSIKLKGTNAYDLIGGGAEVAGDAADKGLNAAGTALEGATGAAGTAMSAIPVVGTALGTATKGVGKVAGTGMKASGKVAKVAGKTTKGISKAASKTSNKVRPIKQRFKAVRGTANKLAGNIGNSRIATTIGNSKLARTIKNPKLRKGLGAVGNRYVRKLTDGKTGTRGALTAIGKVAKTGARIGVGTAVATTGAMLGAAYGIASGDVGKAAQLSISGAVGGYAIGNKTTKAITNRAAGGISSIKDTYKQGADSEEYKQEKIYHSIIDDPAVMDQFREKNKDMNDSKILAGISAYAKEGITDVDDIQTGFDLENKAGVDRDTAMGTVKLSNKFDTNMLMDDKKEQKLRGILEQNLSGRGYSNSKERANESIELMKMANGLTPMKEISKTSYSQPIINDKNIEHINITSESNKKASRKVKTGGTYDTKRDNARKHSNESENNN